MNPLFSIIIPTYNGMKVLPEVLDALGGQIEAPDFEVVIVVDGSKDGTGDWLKRNEFPMSVKVLTQAQLGPAAARNYGVRAAAGSWVAFLGDDTVPSPGWLKAHREAHARHGDRPDLAVVGFTPWHSQLRVTRFMRFISEEGLQFGYNLIEDPEDLEFTFFYTSNLSLWKQRALAEPFNVTFPYAAWEDIETGYRLKRSGMRLIYEKQAQAYHNHPMSVGSFAKRQEKAGYSAVVFYRLHPELGDLLGVGPNGPPALPSKLRQGWREVVARSLQFFPVSFPEMWSELLRSHYIKGLQRGWADVRSDQR